MRLSAVAAAVCMVALCASQGETKTIRGRVLDENGLPVAGATVALYWSWSQAEMHSMNGVRTDSKGEFEISTELAAGQSQNVLCLDMESEQIGVASVTLATASEAVTIRMEPLGWIDADIVAESSEGWRTFYLTSERHGTLYNGTWEEGQTRLPSPAGQITITVSARDQGKVKETVAVEAGLATRVSFALTAANYITLVGQPAPDLVFEDSRGLPDGFSLKDLRGKWVILDFWGFWCGPCYSRGLPNMILLYDRIKKSGLPIEVLAVHERGATTMAELEAHLPALRERYWWGRELPFPILVDADESIAFEYGTPYYPSTMVIDPDGVFRGMVAEGELSTVIEEIASIEDDSYYRGHTAQFSRSDTTGDQIAELIAFGLKAELEIADVDRAVLAESRFEFFATRGSAESALLNALAGTGLGFVFERGSLRIASGLPAVEPLAESEYGTRLVRSMLSRPAHGAFQGSLSEFLVGSWLVTDVPIVCERNENWPASDVRLSIAKGESLLAALADQLGSKGARFEVVNEALVIAWR